MDGSGNRAESELFASSPTVPQSSEIERKLPVMANGEQIHGGGCLHRGVQHQVVAVQVDAQRIRRSRRQCGQLRQRLGRLRRSVQVGPADAREAPQVRDHGRPQFGEQVIESRSGIGVQQERFDRVEAR